MPFLPRDLRGHPSGEVRAVLGGAFVAVMLVLGVAVRLDQAGSSPSPVTAVSVRTLPAYWVVRPAQTLALIARRTGLSIAEIEDLNPQTDPVHLTVGGHIALRPPS